MPEEHGSFIAFGRHLEVQSRQAVTACYEWDFKFKANHQDLCLHLL